MNRLVYLYLYKKQAFSFKFLYEKATFTPQDYDKYDSLPLATRLYGSAESKNILWLKNATINSHPGTSS